jgi:hypothetical protein
MYDLCYRNVLLYLAWAIKSDVVFRRRKRQGRSCQVRCDGPPTSPRVEQWQTYSCEPPSSLIISALQIRQQQKQQFKFHLELFTASCWLIKFSAVNYSLLWSRSGVSTTLTCLTQLSHELFANLSTVFYSFSFFLPFASFLHRSFIPPFLISSFQRVMQTERLARAVTLQIVLGRRPVPDSPRNHLSWLRCSLSPSR